jgi:tryptophan synthase alpha chain
VSTPEHAAQVAGFADGVIVGSAFVRTLRDAPSQAEAAVALSRLATGLRDAARLG